MNLHRSAAQPEWASIATTERTSWQRVAAATRGVVTIGNGMTLLGFGLVVYGLVLIMQHHYLMAAVLLVVGRSCDLADGWLADITATKSPLGELLDAAVDKIGTVATIGILALTSLAAWWVLLALLLPHVIITILAAIARRRSVRLQPSRLGKLSMAAAWVGLVGLVLMPAFAHSYGGLQVIVYGLIWLSVAMGLTTAWTYAHTIARA